MTKDLPPIAGVIGWPIGHSRSPLMHNRWLEEAGIAGAYVPLAIPPEALEDEVNTLICKGFRGFNVTIPHKEAMARLVAEQDAAAARIGAVNTVVIEEDGRLRGLNTDAAGFIENLAGTRASWKSGRALVLGAGGAARAVVYGLAREGVPEISIFNRTRARAEALAKDFAGLGARVEAYGMEDLRTQMKDAALLVNTTSLGMEGAPPLEIDLAPLPAGALVTDIVYVPLETALLEAARGRGLETRDGLGMLIHQARFAFEAWFGRLPAATRQLRQALEEDIEKENNNKGLGNMLLIGLTGSIGMGKSETAKMFARLGIPVYDADAAVHALYAKGGAAVAPIEAAFPGVTRDGAIDREELSKRVLGKPEELKRLEGIIHPLVGKAQIEFLLEAEKAGADMVVLDIPLIFETGGKERVDVVVVVSAPAELQRERVLARPGMTEEKFEAIRAKQVPDAEKRAGADFIVDSSKGLEPAFEEVQAIVAALTGRPGKVWATRKPK